MNHNITLHDVMACIIDILGYTGLLFIALYALLSLLYCLRKKQLAVQRVSHFGIKAMPLLRPVPIPTKKYKRSWINKLLVFVFNVRRWRLEEAFEFTYHNVTYVIPAGFIFDGASIPRFMWALLSPVGLLLIPGLIHDYGYRYNCIYVIKDGNVVLDFKDKGQAFWDELFKNVGNEVNGVFLLNFLATLGLSLGGGCTWKAWREKNKPPKPFRWRLKRVDI